MASPNTICVDYRIRIIWLSSVHVLVCVGQRHVGQSVYMLVLQICSHQRAFSHNHGLQSKSKSSSEERTQNGSTSSWRKKFCFSAKVLSLSQSLSLTGTTVQPSAAKMRCLCTARPVAAGLLRNTFKGPKASIATCQQTHNWRL